MKIERRKRGNAEVYTASLNDIMFFLLLFFLIISTMVTPMAIKVMLPKASTSEQITSKKSINLSVTRDQRYFLNDQEVPFEQVEPMLAQMSEGLSDEEKPNILFQADKALDIQSAVKIIDIGNRLRMKVTILVEKE